MESEKKCPICLQAMSHYENESSPVELDCLHEICLDCVNKQCQWNPQ